MARRRLAAAAGARAFWCGRAMATGASCGRSAAVPGASSDNLMEAAAWILRAPGRGSSRLSEATASTPVALVETLAGRRVSSRATSSPTSSSTANRSRLARSARADPGLRLDRDRAGRRRQRREQCRRARRRARVVGVAGRDEPAPAARHAEVAPRRRGGIAPSRRLSHAGENANSRRRHPFRQAAGRAHRPRRSMPVATSTCARFERARCARSAAPTRC